MKHITLHQAKTICNKEGHTLPIKGKLITLSNGARLYHRLHEHNDFKYAIISERYDRSDLKDYV